MWKTWLPSSIFPLSSLFALLSSPFFPLPSSIFLLRSSSSLTGSIVAVRSSTSTKTGVAPQKDMASAVAMKVLGTVMTSSPGPTPSASRAIQRASVPLPTPTASGQPQKGAKSFSNFCHKGAAGKGGFVDHRLQGGMDFGFNGFVLGFQVQKGNLHGDSLGNNGILE